MTYVEWQNACKALGMTKRENVKGVTRALNAKGEIIGEWFGADVHSKVKGVIYA